MHICMIGDLKYGRTVHSLSTLLSMYKNIKFTLISPRELSMPGSVLDTLENAGHRVTVTEKVDGIVDADIVYQTRIQQERFASPEDADQYRGKFRLNQTYTLNITNPIRSSCILCREIPARKE